MRSERCPTRAAAPLLALLVLPALPAPLAGQAWNAPEALALVRRAVERRAEVQADAMLRSYRTRAHGFVFFLAQVGEGLTEPPRLVKADELDVEVYWQAPDRSKQVISGWRDGAFLPTDIHYHRDHLGIVTNDFGDVIRIGEGDEVRDVPHPLASAGPELYDYALGDSLVIRTGADAIRVRRVEVRPRDFGRPMVVGTLYLDAETAALVRFRFSFTPAAYLDRQLEDISIVLENGRYEGRYWLPYRQDVEIRRRTTWLDFPARGIIRARWEIGDYDLNPALPERIFTGAAIGGLHSPQPDTGQWARPLADAVAGVAQPVTEQDMDALRAEAERIAGARVLSGIPANRPAIGAVSDLVKVNRVQGLAFGIGGVLGLSERRVELRPTLGYGTEDERMTGGLSVTVGQGATQVTGFAERRLQDISDLPVIAPILNSFTAQESGNDYGDYALVDRAGLGVRHRLSGRNSLVLELGAEESHSVATAATPANGAYRANPPLGAGSLGIARLALERASGGMAVRSDLQGRLAVEGGAGDADYLRATAEGRWLTEAGAGELLTRIYAGVGTAGLPGYRSFVLGGRGTLMPEPFRAYGGRSTALAQVEWRLDVPAPAIGLGSFASTGRRMTLAPFLAAGWADRPLGGLPWSDTDGVRPVAGVALEWFMRLLRVETGVGLRDGRVGITVDINRDWWGVL
ncbi:MAG TPA: hypothetical protein VJQ44_08795 [Gemmatimonadales bacterium]|nr:hypothetical protein [Gemmatimonadales bacterium]